MTDRRRDALLALGATAALLLAAPLLGVDLARLTAPASLAASAVGSAAALGIELAMARRPDAARRLWDKRRVRWGGTLLVALGGPVAVALAGVGAGSPVIAALLGGLAAYFLLLAGVCSGVLAPPEAWFADRP